MDSSWLDHAVHWMEVVRATGWIGWLLFIGLYAGLCLLFVPGSVLTMGAGAVYGFWGGLFLVLAGNGAGAVISLLITRYLLRGWAEKYFARNPRMRALQTAVGKEGWKIVCLTHLSPIMPFSVINYAFGLTKISAGEYLLATLAGSMPSACIYVYLGTFLGHLAKIGPEIRHHNVLEWLLQALGLVATIVVTIYISRMASQALNKQMN